MIVILFIFLKVSTPKLSYKPGVARPTTILLTPLDITLPLVTVILEASLSGIIVPNVTTNGVYNVSVLPLTSTLCESVLT